MTWLMDPTSLPPHAAIPELDLTDWDRLKTLSQRDRALILKRSGFHEEAWGARSVRLGSDLRKLNGPRPCKQPSMASTGRLGFSSDTTNPAVTHEWFDFDGRNGLHEGPG